METTKRPRIHIIDRCLIDATKKKYEETGFYAMPSYPLVTVKKEDLGEFLMLVFSTTGKQYNIVKVELNEEWVQLELQS